MALEVSDTYDTGKPSGGGGGGAGLLCRYVTLGYLLLLFIYPLILPSIHVWEGHVELIAFASGHHPFPFTSSSPVYSNKDNSICRLHFSIVVFVGTDFNCFLKSIRRSIPMTVAVKLTSTRRCMTCSFFREVFYLFIEREIWVCASIVRSERLAHSFRTPLVILFRFPFSERSFKFRI